MNEFKYYRDPLDLTGKILSLEECVYCLCRRWEVMKHIGTYRINVKCIACGNRKDVML